MRARNLRLRFLRNSSIIITLCLLISLIAVTKVQAQKRPPILSDKDISAFNKAKVLTLETEAGATNSPKRAKLARNKLIAIAVEQIDTSFNDYRKGYRKNTDLLSFIFDFLEIGTSSAISIVGGARSKTLIGEGLSLFQGSRSAFNKDFRFLERQILFNKMVASRSDKLTAIYSKLNNEADEYPWEQARSELRGYFFAGTIEEALTDLDIDTGAEAQSKEAELAKAKTAAGIVGAVSEMVYQASSNNAKMIDALTLTKGTAVFTAVQGEPTLSPLLATLTTRRGVQPSLKALIEDSLSRINANTATSDDYHLVLLQLNGAATDILPKDPRPNDRLTSILKANQ